MFKQKRKAKLRLSTCRHPKHVFRKNKGKCLCGNYYKDNGRIFRNKGDRYVAGNSPRFQYKEGVPTKKALRRLLKKKLKK